jgi:HEAT repeat protein
LAALGPKVLDRHIEALKNTELRRYAVGVIQRLGSQAAPAVPALTSLLTEDADPELKREVQLALAAIGPEAKQAVPALTNSLSSPESDVRGSAAYALGKIGPAAASASAKLRERFSSDDDQRMQRIAMWALIKINPNDAPLILRAVPLLIEALGSDRELARLEATVALGELGKVAKPAIEPLKKLLTDESPDVRAAAEEAIRKLEQ